MTTKEEIREGLYTLIIHHPEFKTWEEMFDWERELPKLITNYLHSQGVVIRGESLGFSHPHLSAYFTTEPLI